MEGHIPLIPVLGTKSLRDTCDEIGGNIKVHLVKLSKLNRKRVSQSIVSKIHSYKLIAGNIGKEVGGDGTFKIVVLKVDFWVMARNKVGSVSQWTREKNEMATRLLKQ